MNSNQYLNEYYANNAQKLRNKVDKILTKFGGLSQKDYDDFYSLANEVFTDVLKRYDNSKDFDGFLYSCLLNKIKTEMTSRNREKRKADRMAVSIETPIGEDGNITIGELIPDNTIIEEVIFKKNVEVYGEKTLIYLSRLSNLQKMVLNLTIIGYSPKEIIEELHITSKQYADCNAAIHSYKNISVLF